MFAIELVYTVALGYGIPAALLSFGIVLWILESVLCSALAQAGCSVSGRE